MLAFIAERFRDGGRGVGRALSRERWTVGCGHHDGASLESTWTQIAFEKTSYFPAAFADETEDDDVGFGTARHHPEQRALTHAAAAKDADALPSSARQQRVDRANTCTERYVDFLAIHGIQRSWTKRRFLMGEDRPSAVDRPAKAVDHAANQRIAGGHALRSIARDDGITRSNEIGRAHV